MMSPYSRCQRSSSRVESRLAMNEVPIQGSPRGPGGRSGAGAVVEGEAVEAMTKLLRDLEPALIIRHRRDAISGTQVDDVVFVSLQLKCARLKEIQSQYTGTARPT